MKSAAKESRKELPKTTTTTTTERSYTVQVGRDKTQRARRNHKHSFAKETKNQPADRHAETALLQNKQAFQSLYVETQRADDAERSAHELQGIARYILGRRAHRSSPHLNPVCSA